MPKFKKGDLIKNIKTEQKIIVFINELLADNRYLFTVIESELASVSVGFSNWVPFDTLDESHELYNAAKRSISDCSCTSWEMLHKGCNCGYSKALGNTWGLAAQFSKAS